MSFVAGCKSEEARKRESERLNGFAKMAAARTEFAQKPLKEALVTQPYLNGKFVMLTSFNRGEFGFATAPLATRDLIAATVDEVGTVVLQECFQTQKGVYTTTENPPRKLPALSVDCTVTLIDRSIQAIIYVKKFETEPAADVRVSETARSVSSTPSEEIGEFLSSLPRK